MTANLRHSFSNFVDDFLDDYFAVHPEFATAAGVHTYDGQLPDYSERGIARDATRLHRALSRLKRLEHDHARDAKISRDPQFRLEFQLMKTTLESALFDLEEMRPWHRDPNYYNGHLHHALFCLIQRDFAPLRKRVAAMIERERQIPAALSAAKINLGSVPRLVAQLGVRQFENSLHFLQSTLPSAVQKVGNARLLREFEEANAGAIRAYFDFIEHLKKHVVPRGGEKFGIGERRYRRKLWLDEMVDLPLDRLLLIARESLAENHEQFRRVAAEIDPGRPPEELLQDMTRNHPTADELIPSTAGVLDQLREFLISHQIISLPPQPQRGSKPLCNVDESPEVLRELTFASLEIPGPFEKKSREYYYHVTLPDRTWDAEKQEQHLRFFSRQLILTTSIHEAYPGHLAHFLWVNRHPSKIRRLFGSTSHVEGWAHYCEQMMVDEGFGDGDLRLRLAQLHEAQLRLCRFIVGIEMHVNGMSFRRARNFFIKNALMEPVNAERESKRGVVDPTYLVYTLGKMQFLRLRQDSKEKLGGEFSLKAFHDACIQNGFPPIPLLRELLLGERRAAI